MPLVRQVAQGSQHLGHEHGGLHGDLKTQLPRALSRHIWRLANYDTALRGNRRELVQWRTALLVETLGEFRYFVVVVKPWCVPSPVILSQKVGERALLRGPVSDEAVRNLLVGLEVLPVLNANA